MRQDPGTADPDVVRERPAGTAVVTKTPPPPAAQAFEWIQHGDATARRRARAHITRGFRRQKAAEAKKNLEKEKQSESQEKRGEGADKITHAVGGLDAALDDNDSWSTEPGSARHNSQELALHPTLGSGRQDPFRSLPVDLGPGAHALLDHCTCASRHLLRVHKACHPPMLRW